MGSCKPMYGGYNDLYRANRDTGPLTSALCWAYSRRKFWAVEVKNWLSLPLGLGWSSSLLIK